MTADGKPPYRPVGDAVTDAATPGEVVTPSPSLCCTSCYAVGQRRPAMVIAGGEGHCDEHARRPGPPVAQLALDDEVAS